MPPAERSTLYKYLMITWRLGCRLPSHLGETTVRCHGWWWFFSCAPYDACLTLLLPLLLLLLLPLLCCCTCSVAPYILGMDSCSYISCVAPIATQCWGLYMQTVYICYTRYIHTHRNMILAFSFFWVASLGTLWPLIAPTCRTPFSLLFSIILLPSFWMPSSWFHLLVFPPFRVFFILRLVVFLFLCFFYFLFFPSVVGLSFDFFSEFLRLSSFFFFRFDIIFLLIRTCTDQNRNSFGPGGVTIPVTRAVANCAFVFFKKITLRYTCFIVRRNAYVPPFQLATILVFQASHIPQGKLVPGMFLYAFTRFPFGGGVSQGWWFSSINNMIKVKERRRTKSENRVFVGLWDMVSV